MTPTPVSCPAEDCGQTMRLRYPGNDPENGAARLECPRGHTRCGTCGAAITNDVCPACDRQNGDEEVCPHGHPGGVILAGNVWQHCPGCQDDVDAEIAACALDGGHRLRDCGDTFSMCTDCPLVLGPGQTA